VENGMAAKRILIIDDDPVFEKLMEMTLARQGYRVFHARQGKEAMNILGGQCVDLIVLDLMMPEMDGLAFLKWLRGEAGLKTPVLVQTSMVTDVAAGEAINAGATELLYKPAKVPDLLAIINKLTHAA
jgi:DNA-binding response OmpR family regulator